MTSIKARFMAGAAVWVCAFAVSGNADQLTLQQCEEYQLIEEVSLTEAQQQSVTASCEERFNSLDAISQCAYQEGEMLRLALAEQAASLCQ